MPRAPRSARGHKVGVRSTARGSYPSRTASLSPSKSGGPRIGGNKRGQSTPAGTALAQQKSFPRLSSVMAKFAKVGN